MTWYKTSFKTPAGIDPVVLDMQGMGKGQAWDMSSLKSNLLAMEIQRKNVVRLSKLTLSNPLDGQPLNANLIAASHIGTLLYCRYGQPIDSFFSLTRDLANPHAIISQQSPPVAVYFYQSPIGSLSVAPSLPLGVSFSHVCRTETHEVSTAISRRSASSYHDPQFQWI
ncbi:hypothetical protein E6C27_scaffold149G001660 [Cucumis melo var. makuwa]|uniref:Beta-galactosidase galactose-binding domain-containing protein n=1 Tax=Cucumis melo var. makuwa TaxID=1194695 RepID=A0A5A7TTF6_CUCMM|nr:hypothetical protein E6C27_scaffold149G001660 [Cucumis melo var. makuwa]